jgi:pimeloyl-ACP methyl ester carboxylesterase
MSVYLATGVALASLAVLAGCANAHASPGSGGPAANTPPAGPRPSVVLVHGNFVDGSGWKGVYKILTRDGYPVTVVQNPTVSLADDVAVTRRAIGTQSGPVILVGHSYGGAVISEAGNDPKVAALVFITAFAPDKGESVQTLIGNPPPGAGPPIVPLSDGFLVLDRSKFPAAFAADVDADEAAFMAASQVPAGPGSLSGVVNTPAWRTKPSFYLMATADKMIPPPAQQSMAKRAGAIVTEAAGSHAIFVSKPDVVASVIEQAAAAAATAAKGK